MNALRFLFGTRNEPLTAAHRAAPLRHVATLAAATSTLLAATLAYASEWQIVGGDAYKNSEGEWVAWIADGEGNRLTVKGKSKRDARNNGQAAADALNAQGCFERKVFGEGDGPAAAAADGDFVGIPAVSNGDGTFTARFEALEGGGGSAVRGSAAAANAVIQSVVTDLNAGRCAAF